MAKNPRKDINIIIIRANKSIRRPKEIAEEEKYSSSSGVLETAGKSESTAIKVTKEKETARESLIFFGKKKVKIPPITGTKTG